MDRYEVLDPAPAPVDLALVFTDRAQFVTVDEHRAVLVGIEPCAKTHDRVRLMLLVALDQEIRPVAGEGGRGTFEDGEFVSFDIDLDEPDVGQGVVVDAAGLNLELFGARDYLRVELVGRIDR